jgi:hypothetical protein
VKWRAPSGAVSVNHRRASRERAWHGGCRVRAVVACSRRESGPHAHDPVPRARERHFDPGAVHELTAAATRDLIVGGPNLAEQAVKAKLVDEYHLFNWPVVRPLTALVGGPEAGARRVAVAESRRLSPRVRRWTMTPSAWRRERRSPSSSVMTFHAVVTEQTRRRNDGTTFPARSTPHPSETVRGVCSKPSASPWTSPCRRPRIVCSSTRSSANAGAQNRARR